MALITKNSIIFMTGIVLILISSILYLSLYLTVIQNYNNESSFKKTTCTVRAVEIHKMNSKEDWYKCPWKCTLQHTLDGLKTYCELSEFPCLRIVVDVYTSTGLKSAILHENPNKFKKYSDCSTYYCERDSVVNEKYVRKFERNYGKIGSKLPCYYDLNSLISDDYDDDGQEHALLKLTYNTASYVNSLLWPSLCGFVGLILTFYGLINLYKKNDYKKTNRKNDNI